MALIFSFKYEMDIDHQLEVNYKPFHFRAQLFSPFTRTRII